MDGRFLPRPAEDRKERRRKLGLPEELTEEEKQAEAAKAAEKAKSMTTKMGVAVKPVTGGLLAPPPVGGGRLTSMCHESTLSYSSHSLCGEVLLSPTAVEKLRGLLVDMKKKDGEDKAKLAWQTLLKYLGNVARAPDEDKFRTIKLSNEAFQKRVGSAHGGVEFLEGCGFQVGWGAEQVWGCSPKRSSVLKPSPLPHL